MDMQPNILMITCHDLGQHLGCYGRSVNTPNTDRLAAEGVRFDNYFCTAPQCSPSRGSIMTGRYPHSTGFMGLVGFGGWQLPETEITIPKALRTAGYETWLWGFQHEHSDPATLGYDHDPIGYKKAEVHKILAGNITPPLCEWLRQSHNKPFFASVGFFETHIPFPVTPVPANSQTEQKTLPYLPDHPALRQDITELENSVRQMDFYIGRILQVLDETGLADNTLVIFTTDHGIAFPRAKCSLYDAGTKTALIMRLPKYLQQNRVITELLSNVDLMPTLLDLAGVDKPDQIEGQSFASLLHGGEYSPRREVFTEMTWHDAYAPMRAIRTNRYKYIKYFDSNIPRNLLPKDFYQCCAGSEYFKKLLEGNYPEYELFDLAADPHEQHNLAGKGGYRNIVDDLDARLTDLMKQTNDPLLNGHVNTPKPFIS